MLNQSTLETFHSKIVSGFSSAESNEDRWTTRQWMERTYRRMHRIAVSQMNYENKDHTLSATGLIHEVFVRLQNRDRKDLLAERQFLSIVFSEMKQILIDWARRKQAAKRGGGRCKLELNDGLAAEELAEEQLADSVSELTEAVEQFGIVAPEAAEVVRLRYFLGLSEIEAAEALGISRATASRKWAFARAWLLNYMAD